MSSLHTLRAFDWSDLRIREVRAEGSLIVPSHHHACAHVTLVAAGTVTDSDGDTLEVLHAGDVLFRPAGAVHENLVADPGSRGVVIEVEPPLLTMVCAAWNQPAEAIRTDTKTLNGLPTRIIHELATDDRSSPLILRGLVLEMLGVGTRLLRPAGVTQPPHWVAAALNIVNDRYTEPLTIGKVCREVGVMPSRMRDELRRWHGKTFSALLRDRRIAAALALLDGDTPMEEIAVRCGFYDQSHFIRAFRAVRGTTPYRCRQRQRR